MKAFLFSIIVLFTACNCGETDNKNVSFKYALGDVVLVKPDSMKATISDRYYYGVGDNGDNGIRYKIQYYTPKGDSQEDYIKEFQIFGKQNKF